MATSAPKKKRTGKFIVIPERIVRAPTGMTMIVKYTKQYAVPMLLELPDVERFDLEKKAPDIGEVVAVGSEIFDVFVGDVILYRVLHGYPIPNGPYDVFMYKIDYPFSLIAKVQSVWRLLPEGLPTMIGDEFFIKGEWLPLDILLTPYVAETPIRRRRVVANKIEA